MSKKFLLQMEAEERCYWFRIGVDSSGDETVEIYDDVVGSPTLILPADASVLNLIRDGLERCCFFIGEGRHSRPDEIEPVVLAREEVAAPVETRSSMEITKAQHARAYEPWSPEEDEELLFKWRETQSRKELAAHFGRNTGAISSRARKLGLIE